MQHFTIYINCWRDDLFYSVTSDSSDAKRAWCLDQMGAILRHPAVQVDDHTINLILEHLIIHGHFVVKKKIHKNLSDTVTPSRAFDSTRVT